MSVFYSNEGLPFERLSFLSFFLKSLAPALFGYDPDEPPKSLDFGGEAWSMTEVKEILDNLIVMWARGGEVVERAFFPAANCPTLREFK